MPRIFDNFEQKLLPALAETLAVLEIAVRGTRGVVCYKGATDAVERHRRRAKRTGLPYACCWSCAIDYD